MSGAARQLIACIGIVAFFGWPFFVFHNTLAIVLGCLWMSLMLFLAAAASASVRRRHRGPR